MSGRLKKSAPYWAEAMAADGFFIECGRSPEGEWFNIISREAAMFDGLRKIPADSWIARTSSPVNNFWFLGGLTEADVRSKLALAGLSADDIAAKLEWARRWVTTIARQPASEPVLWRPRLVD
jgi:hypothetical protein